MADIYWFCSDEQYQPEELVKHARLAEESGFDGIMMSEHFHPWVSDNSAAGFAYSTLGAISVLTKHVKLMTTVTAPLFRFHPAVVAQAAATIDRLSGGRFMLGVGSGENINEGPLGFELPPYKERQERLSEAYEIISRLLGGEKLDFNGNYYRTKSAKLYSPPLHHVPILLAAGGPQTASSVKIGYDGLITSVKDTAETIQSVIKPARAATTKPDFILCANRWSVYGQSDDEAWEALQPHRGMRAPSRVSAIDPLILQQEADDSNPAEILAKYSIVKDMDEYYSVYAPLISELHADIVGIQTVAVDQAAVIKQLGEQLVPRLKKL